MTNLHVAGKVGEGSFSDVFRAKSNDDGKYYAVKRLKKRFKSRSEAVQLPEILTLELLRGHPNIVDMKQFVFDADDGYVAMVFEMLDCNIYELVTKEKNPLSERHALLLTYQLLQAVDFMHSKNVFHRDIKPDNCMVDRASMTLKLVDFGSARSLFDKSPYTEYISTRWYRAPECILTNGSYGREIDIWAIGCIFYELVMARPMFAARNEMEQIGKIHAILGSPSVEVLRRFEQNANTSIDFEFPHRPPMDLRRRFRKPISSSSLDLLQLLLRYDPDKRPSAATALRHAAFSEIRVAEREWRERGANEAFGAYFVNGEGWNVSEDEIIEVLAETPAKMKVAEPVGIECQGKAPRLAGHRKGMPKKLEPLMGGEQEMRPMEPVVKSNRGKAPRLTPLEVLPQQEEARLNATQKPMVSFEPTPQSARKEYVQPLVGLQAHQRPKVMAPIQAGRVRASQKPPVPIPQSDLVRKSQKPIPRPPIGHGLQNPRAELVQPILPKITI